jgi:hypothetical protein
MAKKPFVLAENIRSAMDYANILELFDFIFISRADVLRGSTGKIFVCPDAFKREDYLDIVREMKARSHRLIVIYIDKVRVGAYHDL